MIWAWREIPAMRRQMIAGIVLIPVLWLGIPALTSKSPFAAASLAQNSPREIHGNKFAGGIALWVVVEAAFALHGWPAVPRYMYEAGAGVCVLAGVFAGRVILDAGATLAWLRLPSSPRIAAWAAAIVLAVFAGSLVPAAHGRLNYERADLTAQRARTHEIALLESVVQRLGAGHILACGQPNIYIGFQSVLAWDLGTNTGTLYFSRKYEQEHRHPIVNMYPHSYGWQFFGSDWTNATQAARCRGLTYRT